MALTNRNSLNDANSTNLPNRVVAFFNNKENAFRAVADLKQAGFTNSEIGLAVSDDDYDEQTDSRKANLEAEGANSSKDRSFWGEVKDFFTGENYDDYNEDFRNSTESMDWDDNRRSYYHQGITAGGALLTVTGSRTQEARRILEKLGGDLRETGFDTSSGVDRSSTMNLGREQNARYDNERRIQLRGEMLHTYKERVKSGEARLRKEVITENKTVQVPVTREELVIERNPVAGDTRATGSIGDDQDIHIPLTEERVRVTKQPTVTEEVKVGKRQVQSTERVSDDVRHEELRVEKDGKIEPESVDVKKKRKDPAA